MTTTTKAPAAQEQRDALGERLFGSPLGGMELLAVEVGLRLGLYQALRDSGPASPGELGARTGTDERYAREWMEQQAVAGLLEVAEASEGPAERRYALPAGHAEALLERDSPGTWRRRRRHWWGWRS